MKPCSVSGHWPQSSMMIASRGAPVLGPALAFGAGVVASGASLGYASGGDDVLAVDERSLTAGAVVRGGEAAPRARAGCCGAHAWGAQARIAAQDQRDRNDHDRRRKQQRDDRGPRTARTAACSTALHHRRSSTR